MSATSSLVGQNMHQAFFYVRVVQVRVWTLRSYIIQNNQKGNNPKSRTKCLLEFLSRGLRLSSSSLCRYATPADIDTATLMGDGRGVERSDGGVFPSLWCTWSDDPEILQTLLAEFRGAGAGAGSGSEAGEEKGAGGEEEEEEDGERSDVHMHLSEVR